MRYSRYQSGTCTDVLWLGSALILLHDILMLDAALSDAEIMHSGAVKPAGCAGNLRRYCNSCTAPESRLAL